MFEFIVAIVFPPFQINLKHMNINTRVKQRIFEHRKSTNMITKQLAQTLNS